MSRTSLALASMALSLAAGLSLHDTGLPYCSWSPLTRLEETPYCETGWVKTSRFHTHGNNHTNVSTDDEWNGPRGCVEQYCIYTNQDFSGGQGMVVITTASNLPLVRNLPSRLPATKERSSPAFHVSKVPGKGLGLVADKALKRGDGVMNHGPAFLAHRDFIERTAREEQHRLLELAASLLPSPTKDKFLSQHGHFGGHHISDILATNSFQINLGGDNGQHFGNYPDVSRFNHDCRPNVAYYIDANLTHHSSATRPIRPGEELTISYLDPLESHDARQQRTQAAWGFACGCSHCSRSRAGTSESDSRLQRIRKLEAKLENINAHVTMGMVQRLLQLYRDERLENKMSGGLTLAALNSNLLGRDDEAKTYALEAVEAGLIEGGETGDVKAMRALAQDPKAHFTWRKRLRG